MQVGEDLLMVKMLGVLQGDVLIHRYRFRCRNVGTGSVTIDVQPEFSGRTIKFNFRKSFSYFTATEVFLE
jgi:FKBP-type peptidyl-prolyl cis-trans isomerase 2